jgi:ribosomal subunit interface protein
MAFPGRTDLDPRLPAPQVQLHDASRGLRAAGRLEWHSATEMSLQVTGKNVEVGEAFQGFVAEKLAGVLGKYDRRHLAAHVRVEKERGRFRTGCSVRLKTGQVFESAGEGHDAYTSADAALERLDKRLRRYKRRVRSRHARLITPHRPSGNPIPAR